MALMLAGIWLSGCSDGVSGRNGVMKAITGDTISLAVGETATWESDGLKLGFERVTSESRCPLEVECVWEGIGRISVWLLKSDQDTANVTPAIMGGGFDPRLVDILSGSALGYRIDLLALVPYPLTPGPIEEKQYVATLRISEYEPPDADSMVIITDLPPELIQLHRFDLDGLSIYGDILTVTVQYSGGCEDHDLLMFMSPDSFLESHPVQANLYIRHDDNDDACDAWITETIRFDMRPVRDLYNQMYDSGNTVVLNVFEYFEETPQNHRSVVYTF